MSFEILPLAARPELVPVLADALREAWPEWYGVQPRAQTVAEMQARAQADAIPACLVALEDGELAGTAAIAAASIDSHAHLTPWLVGLWVRPVSRRRGVGGRLVAASRELAAHLGLPVLHAATADAGPLFLADGWAEIDAVELEAHPGARVGVYRCEPGVRRASSSFSRRSRRAGA